MAKVHKIFRLLEIVWLVIALVGVGTFIYAMIVHRRDQAVYFSVFTVIAGIMYAVRKRQRKLAEEVERKNENK